MKPADATHQGDMSGTFEGNNIRMGEVLNIA